MVKDYKELYEERAGIMQFDGKLPQKEAEEKALIEITNLFIKDENLSMSEAATYSAINKLKKALTK